MVNSSEFIELIQMDNDVYCCICLNTSKESDLQFNYIDFIKMDCCNQRIHKNCFLDWIIHPIKSNKKYDNKFHCIICKTKIINLQNTIKIGDFINYITNDIHCHSKTLLPYDSTILHYKKIISELYKDNIITIMLKSDEYYYLNKGNKYFFNNICFVFIFLIMIFLLIIVVKNEI